jgi:hypothetical protein
MPPCLNPKKALLKEDTSKVCFGFLFPNEYLPTIDNPLVNF